MGEREQGEGENERSKEDTKTAHEKRKVRKN